MNLVDSVSCQNTNLASLSQICLINKAASLSKVHTVSPQVPLTHAHFLVVLLPGFSVVWLTPRGLCCLILVSRCCCGSSWSLGCHGTPWLLAIILCIVGCPCCILVCCCFTLCRKKQNRNIYKKKKKGTTKKIFPLSIYRNKTVVSE